MDKIKIITYNIDGLPPQLDLRELPWTLRPLAWIYKLAKGTTVVTVNDNDDVQENIRKIGRMLDDSGADIVAVQEDFDYHNELLESMADDYECGKHTGGFDIKSLWKSTEWKTRFPLPRFKADGLNVFTRNDRVTIFGEEIVSWRDSFGYVSHASDLLTHKGFRYYKLAVGTVMIDFYVVHMDADFYDAEECPDVTGDVEARRSQFAQLAEHILARFYGGSCRNVIIAGDTNSYPQYSWDDGVRSFIDRVGKVLTVSEAVPAGFADVDRLFFINNPHAGFELKVASCRYDRTVQLSDHYPFIVELSLFDV